MSGKRQITTVSLTIFDAEQLSETVRGSDFEHVQLSGGPFRGRLLRRHFADSTLDAGSYSQNVLVRGAFPEDRIVLGYVLAGREAGYFNGMRLAAHDIVVIAEGGGMEPYRLPAKPRKLVSPMPCLRPSLFTFRPNRELTRVWTAKAEP